MKKKKKNCFLVRFKVIVLDVNRRNLKQSFS